MSEKICPAHSGMVEAKNEQKEATARLFALFEKVMNRPPLWCTWAMTVMGGVIGFLSALLANNWHLLSAGSVAAAEAVKR